MDSSKGTILFLLWSLAKAKNKTTNLYFYACCDQNLKFFSQAITPVPLTVGLGTELGIFKDTNQATLVLPSTDSQ